MTAGPTRLLRAAALAAALLLPVATAEAGTIVIGLNRTSSADQSKVQQYATDGTFLGTLTGPSTVLDPTSFGQDSAGNLYIGSQDNSRVVKVAPDGTVSTFKSGLGALLLMTVGPDDGVYFTRTSGGSTVERIDQDGTIETIVSGIASPRAIAFDAAGALYYSAGGNAGNIFKFDFGASMSTLFATLGTAATEMAFDSLGNLLVVAELSNAVKSIAADGTVATFATAGLDRPNGIAIDDGGNVYVSNFNGGTVRKFAASGADHGAVVSGLTQPTSVGFWNPAPASTVSAPGALLSLLAGLGALAALRRRRTQG